MIYITGDTHGDMNRIIRFCERMETSQEDIMIILGDVGLNYYGDSRDRRNKEKVANLPITLFCIHGNHERRPTTIVEYKLQEWNGGKVWVEEAYPNILFAKDGEIYDIAGMKTIVIGGAYSVDKFYGLSKGYKLSSNLFHFTINFTTNRQYQLAQSCSDLLQSVISEHITINPETLVKQAFRGKTRRNKTMIKILFICHGSL